MNDPEDDNDDTPREPQFDDSATPTNLKAHRTKPFMIDLRPGATVWKDFSIVGPIGQGGQYCVYEIRNAQGKRLVLKFITPRCDNRAARRRLRREFRNLERFCHANLVRVVDFQIAKPPAFLIMEFVDGDTVAKRLRPRGPLPASWTRSLARQTARALDAMHCCGIVHRDVAPRNIMETVLPDGSSWFTLIDGGLSKDLLRPEPFDVTDSENAVFNLSHGARETFDGCDYTPAADIFSLALVVGECMTGMTPRELRVWADRGRGETLPGLTPPESSALASALSVIPSERPATAGEFVTTLIGEPPLPSPPMAHIPTKRRRLAWFTRLAGFFASL
jgi:serine/threonine protein kinase